MTNAISVTETPFDFSNARIVSAVQREPSLCFAIAVWNRLVRLAKEPSVTVMCSLSEKLVPLVHHDRWIQELTPGRPVHLVKTQRYPVIAYITDLKHLVHQ